MGYCKLYNLTDKLDPAILLQLCDDEGHGDLEHEDVRVVWEEAIEAASSLIDSYCRGRYDVPFASPPRVIKDLCADIAIYELYSRRGDAIPDNRIERYKNAMRMLQAISRGDIELGVTGASQGNEVSLSSADRIFTREQMGGF